jgi:very-short-patch-repair endonuclease
VVCDKAFQVLAVIELDDASHKGKTDKDAARDAMLVSAGYRVLRYPNIPDLDRVRSDFLPTTPPAQAQRQAPVPS